MASQGQIPKPIITPSGGPPNGGQYVSEVPGLVKIRPADDPNVIIYYTTDGSDPEKIGSNRYRFDLEITKNTTVKAIAVKEDYEDSSIATETYYVKVAPPVFNYSEGQYPEPFLLKLTTETYDAKIFYTTDGSTPTENSTLYDGEIEINEDIQITAIAIKPNCVDSNIIQGEYTISENSTDGTGTIGDNEGDNQTGGDNSDGDNSEEGGTTQGTLPRPQFNPTTFESETPITVQITMPEGSPTSRIYYTTDGTEPTRESTVYSTGISIEETTMIKAFATAVNYTDSNVNTKTYTISQPPITYPFDIISNETDTSILINGSEIEDKTPYLLILTEEQLQQRVIITARKNGFVSNERYEIYIDNSFGDLRVDYFLNNETATNPNSSGESISFTLQPQLPILPPQFSDDGDGILTAPFTLTLTNPNGNNSNTFIEYSIAEFGSPPSDNYQLYNDNIVLQNGIFTIKARVKENSPNSDFQPRVSEPTTKTFAVGSKPPKPEITGENGNVTIISNREGTKIYYTTSGNDPDINTSQEYTSPFTIDTTKTIKAIAVAELGDNVLQSDVAEKVITVINLPQKPIIQITNGFVSISAESDVNIYYTIDGNDPTQTSTEYTGEFEIEQFGETIVKAIAIKVVNGKTYSSSIATQTYNLVDNTPNAPTIKQNNEDTAGPVEVTITKQNSTDEIFYTINGGTPDTNSTKYNSPFSIDTTSTIRAIAVRQSNGEFLESDVAEKVITVINLPQKPIIEDNDGTVTISSADGTRIYYTTSGNDPDINTSQEYTIPFTVDKTTTVSAITVIRIGDTFLESDVAEKIVTIVNSPQPPTIQITNGIVSISTEEGARIYYTTDETDPGFNTLSTEYTGEFGIQIGGQTTIKAISIKVVNGTSYSSDIATQTYNLVDNTPNAPTITIEGDFTNPDEIPTAKISHSDTSVKLYYSTNGAVPIIGENGQPDDDWSEEYQSPIEISETTTIIAVAVIEVNNTFFKSSYTTETVEITISNPSPPTFEVEGNPNGTERVEVRINKSNPNDIVYFTDDGSTPTFDTNGNPIGNTERYGSTLTPIKTTTIRAVSAKKFGDNSFYSDEVEQTVTFNLQKPQILPSNLNTYEDYVDITILHPVDGASIYYTTDGTTPTNSSNLYNGKFTIDNIGQTTVKAIAIKDGFTDSDIDVKIYTVETDPNKPTFEVEGTPDGTEHVEVRIKESNPNDIVYFTINDNNPTFDSNGSPIDGTDEYSFPLSLNKTTTLKAISVDRDNPSFRSGISERIVTFTTRQPIFVTPDDNYLDEVDVELSAPTPESTIYYTLDGSNPTTNSNQYTTPFTVTESTNVKAIAVKDGFSNSLIAEREYNIVNEPFKPKIDIEGKLDGSGNRPPEARLRSSDSNAKLYYSTNENRIPNVNENGEPIGSWVEYQSPIALTKTTTIRAIAVTQVDDDFFVSDVTTRTAQFVAAKPFFSPQDLYFSETNRPQIKLFSVTPNADIHYTTNGSTPTKSSPKYSGEPFTVTETTTVRAITIKNGYSNSNISEKEYEILDVPPNPTITSTGNRNGSDNVLVRLSTPTTNNNFEIYYTTDGTNPIVGVNGNTNASTKKYTNRFSIDRTTTIKAKTSLFIGNKKFDSNVSERTFEFKVSKPRFNPNGGVYEGSKEVSLSTPTPNATIYYTTDGSTPNRNSQRYRNPFTITKTGQVRAIALRSGYTTSDVSESGYTILIPRSVAIERIAEGFLSQLDDEDLDTFKYLSHLLHLGEGDNKVITNWLGVEDEEGEQSLIFKLYEPLPTSIQENDKAWVSRLQSEPIIETVTIVGGDDKYCTPLKGPNFSIEVDNGIGFEVYNDLIASGSTTSANLVNEYTQKLGIDTEKLFIEYVSGSQIEFKNFTHFGSAEERVKNFWYKLELIESYISTLETISNSDIDLTTIPTNTGSILITGSNNFNLSEISLSPTQRLEAGRVVENIYKVVRELDGFEKFLYNDDSELAYPKIGLVLKQTTENDSKNWYSNTVVAAKLFDRNNVHYINNNLPIHITTDYENEDFLLFMDMIGHHFDIIWSYINSLARGKRLEHKVNKGITNELVYSMLESLGWDTNQSYDGKFLWEYVFGQNRDSSQKYEKTLKSANEEVWRRILNNLPYLLKHKGTKRSLSAVLATYGVPSYLLSIEEFGGPTNTEEQSMNYTFEDQTAAINFTGKESIDVSWKSINGEYPNTIELNLNFDEPQNSYLVKGGDNWNISTIQTTGSFGKILFNISGSTELKTLQTDEIRLFNDEYKQIVLTSEYGNFTFIDDITNDGGQTYDEDYTKEIFYSTVSENTKLISTLNSGKEGTLYAFDLPDIANDIFYQKFNLYVKESKNERIRISEMKSLPVDYGSEWGIPSTIEIGSASFDGKLDEFRLWKTSLTEDVINNHTLIPDAINGNSYTGSSDDLWFRMDFEYPKNRNTDTSIKNVSISSEYNQSSGSAINFDSITEYPYNYTTYTRDVTVKVPLIGNTFSNKIRFEEQELITDLSYIQRATKKSFDRAPVDSPRLGIFLSPTKELNLTMLRSFGEFNIDNYIGDPSNRYSDTYTELKDVRDYFFQRITRNFNEYIQLVRYINKSLFKDLENLIPSRAKVSKGLLIEPHLLERSKVRWNKPQSERGDYETSINVDETNTIELEYGGYEGETSINDDIEFQTEYFYEESDIEYQNPQLDVEQSSIETDIEYQNPQLDVEQSSIETDIEYQNPQLDVEQSSIETDIEYQNIQLDSTYSSLETIIDYDSETELNSTYDSLETLIDYDTETQLSGENLGYEFQINAPIGTTIQTNIGITDFSQIGFDLETGFGLYASASHGKVTTLDIFGNQTSSRQEIYLVKERYTEKIEEQTGGWPLDSEEIAPTFEIVDKERIRYKITKIPFGGNEPLVGGNILEVTPLNGYFPSHYKFKNNLSEGLQRSFFKGSTQTESTTPDGLPPVEIITTNPNILRVADTGRGSGEPILIVD